MCTYRSPLSKLSKFFSRRLKINIWNVSHTKQVYIASFDRLWNGLLGLKMVWFMLSHMSKPSFKPRMIIISASWCLQVNLKSPLWNTLAIKALSSSRDLTWAQNGTFSSALSHGEIGENPLKCPAPGTTVVESPK